MQTSTVLTSIADAMTPYVGKMMARSSIEMHCKKIGIGNGTVQREQVEELLRRLTLGLNIFIGREKTDELIERIRGGMVWQI